jgi:hypothetical protein
MWNYNISPFKYKCQNSYPSPSHFIPDEALNSGSTVSGCFKPEFCKSLYFYMKTTDWLHSTVPGACEELKLHLDFRLLKPKDRLLTYLLTELSLSWEAANCAATQELPSILWKPRFITVFTRALQWSLSWARSTQSTPSHSISLRYIILKTLWFCVTLVFNADGI